ncbi:receptor expression-enhancing protein 5-like protein [Leptotrombidium deliense]|uniref:Receptor expression-enhancing protein n=1 Tax=Leptotrombidium deliense TaxID=299467 RepID=A0A443SPY1_9ACAR|nr:receptor expression-enhancing protein 5-like protein [Leptotrombidium deliense]
MAGIYNDAMKQLEEWLQQKNKVTELLDKVEKTTGVKKLYIVQGFLGFLSIYMILGHFAEFICNGVGFVYPAYASIAALESANKDDDTKWLTYWVVFAFFSVLEFFSDTLFSWFPFYWLAKVRRGALQTFARLKGTALLSRIPQNRLLVQHCNKLFTF